MKEERETINGKPYFGVWVGTYIWINGNYFFSETEKNAILESSECILRSWLNENFKKVDFRHTKLILRPPLCDFSTGFMGSVGIKSMIWGRAFEVMRHFKKGKVRYKKTRAGGRIKWRKIKNK